MGAKMHKYMALLYIISLISCSNDIAWDFYDEGLTNMQIADQSYVEVGVNVESAPSNAVVDSAVIEVEIIHDDPFNLDIRLIHDDDTILVWDNNYPGGCQIYEPDLFYGKTANGYWALGICDSVNDGKEGVLKKFTLKIEFDHNF